MSKEFEKEFDDEVYEDDYYEEGFEEESLSDEDMIEEEIEVDIEEEEEGDKNIPVILACDDCDYRWEDIIVKQKDEDIEDLEIICPMCGSTNVTQI